MEKGKRAPEKAKKEKELLERVRRGDAKSGDKWTALMWAAAEGHEEVARTLLGAGADPNARETAHERWTPLMTAAWNGHAEVARRLLEAGANLEGRAPNGLMAEDLAARAKRPKVERMLKAERVAKEEARALGAVEATGSPRGKRRL